MLLFLGFVVVVVGSMVLAVVGEPLWASIALLLGLTTIVLSVLVPGLLSLVRMLALHGPARRQLAVDQLAERHPLLVLGYASSPGDASDLRRLLEEHGSAGSRRAASLRRPGGRDAVLCPSAAIGSPSLVRVLDAASPRAVGGVDGA